LEIHDIGANEFVVNTIDNGYVIAVIRNPPPMFPPYMFTMLTTSIKHPL
jgi:hypothetical protein